MVIEGKEKVPMQVDGEAWLQDPGVIEVTHKNKARMIVKDKVSQRMLVELGAGCRLLAVALQCVVGHCTKSVQVSFLLSD